MKQRVIISKQLQTDLAEAIAECEHDRIFVLVDETTNKLCWSLVKDYLCLKDAQTIIIGATDRRKNLDTLVHVWESLQQGKATRHSLLINLGGGMVTDLGGFAASTYKRGINFINIPTTLLAMVDASVGGKTGFNFGGLKNEIGVFNDAEFVLLDTNWLQTLDEENIRSGYAEMLKHGLIADDTMWAELINFNIAQPNLHQLAFMLDKSVRIKERIVAEDPHEIISDRKLVKIIKLLKISAYLNGREKVDFSDLMLLTNCLWNNPENIEKVTRMVLDAVKRNIAKDEE